MNGTYFRSLHLFCCWLDWHLGKIAVRTFRPHNGMHVEKHFSLPGLDGWRQRKQYSMICTASPCRTRTIYVVLTLKRWGLIMKQRQCQSLNSDVPVVTSLGSMTSSFIMNSRPLVSPERRRKDAVMEGRKSGSFTKWKVAQLTVQWERALEGWKSHLILQHYQRDVKLLN